MSYRSITGVNSYPLKGSDHMHLQPRLILCKLVWHTVRVAFFRQTCRFCGEFSFPKLQATTLRRVIISETASDNCMLYSSHELR